VVQEECVSAEINPRCECDDSLKRCRQLDNYLHDVFKYQPRGL